MVHQRKDLVKKTKGHFRGSGTLMGYKNVKIKLVSILSIYTFLESPDNSEYGYECKKC